MTCPICKTKLETKGPAFPFCSERCRLIDLGNWLGEGYKVPETDDSTERSHNPETNS